MGRKTRTGRRDVRRLSQWPRCRSRYSQLRPHRSPSSDGGNTWGHSAPGSDHGRAVISPDGEWLGQVEAPPRFRILDVTGGLVLGVLRDEMDVENVVVYELVGDGA